MRRRVIQAVLLAGLVAAGVSAYRSLVHPRRDDLNALAEAPLRELFGPEVTHDRPITFDLADGVVLENLRVPTHQGFRARTEAAGGTGAEGLERLVGFQARTVRIEHDPLALAAGRYQPRAILIEGARIITRETPTGIAPDFPFDLSSDLGEGGPIPSIAIRDAELLYRARSGSERLREGRVLVVRIEDLTLTPDASGTIRVRGVLGTRGLGQDDARITLTGSIEPDGAAFDLEAEWDPFELTSELLATLPEELAETLRQRSIRSGTFKLTLERHGGVAEGAIRPTIIWDSDVEISVPDLPGLDTIDASTKEQLQELFGRGALQLKVAEDRVNIESLVTEMAGGRVHATGWVLAETGEFKLDFEILDLHLEDPAVRRALGPEGASLYDEFDPSGVVDAVGQVTRSASGEVEWKVDVLLEAATLRYVGDFGESGQREGFPYRVEEATGRVRIRPEGVTFDDIVGFNRGAEIRIVGHAGSAWTGGETGRIRFTDDGVDVRLTVVATNVPFDERLTEAIAGSEFTDMMADFDLDGVIDVIEVDVIKIPAIEQAAKTELRITLEGEEFRYAPFPLPLEDVRGQITMRRPVLGAARGRIYAFDVTGWAEGAPLRVSAQIVEHEARGRLHVTADGIPLAGAVTETVLTSRTTSKTLGPVWRWLGPRGKAQVTVDLPLSDDPDPLRLTAQLQGASIRLDAEGSDSPIEFDDLQGTLEVTGDDVELVGVRGTLGEAQVEVAGVLRGGVGGIWDLQAQVAPFRITPRLQSALRQLASGGELLPYGMRFQAGSRMALDLDLHRAARAGAELEVAYTASEIDAVVDLPEGGELGLTGREIEVRDGVVRAREIAVDLGGLTVSVPEARVELGDAPAASGRFELAMDDFELSGGLLSLVPEDAAELLREWTAGRLLSSESFRIDAPQDGPVTLAGDLALRVPPGEAVGEGPRGRVVLAPLVLRREEGDVALGGLVELRGFSMDVGVELEDLDGRIRVDRLRLGAAPAAAGRFENVGGKVAGVRIAGLDAPVQWQEGTLRVSSLQGEVSGGRLQGHFVMQTDEPLAYEGAARVTDFDVARLRDDLAPTGPPYEGRGTAEVRFQNRGGSLRELTAAGFVRIRKGALGDLPFLANVFALVDEIFGLEGPPQFERADVDFVLEKEVFRFRRFHLAGPLFDMPGTGTLDTTGVIDLRFTPDFIKSLALPGVMQLPGLGPLLRGVFREEVLYALRVRGDLDSAEPELVILPPLGLDEGNDFEGTGARTLPRRKLPGWFR